LIEQFIYSYDSVCDRAADRRSKLDEANNLHQFFRDIDDEEAWIKSVHLYIHTLEQ
jgi:spectrin alpha